MIPKECKRLAEVDFPIAEVSRHGAREKSIRHGHPSTLHLWWARRPLASSRAVLMALLLPDPCDPQCPDEFKGKARETLLAMRGRASGWDSTVKTDEGLRRVLLRFIADFANWDNSAKAEQLLAPKPKEAEPEPERDETPVPTPDPAPTPPGGQQATPMPQKVTLQIRGTVPYESWNTLGTRILPKIRSGEALNLSVDLSVQVDAGDFNYAGVGAQACGLGIQDRKVLGHPILSHLNSRPAIAAATMLFKRDHTVSATRYAAQVVEGVDMALDEAGRVSSPHELHIDGPRPTEHHDESPSSPIMTSSTRPRAGTLLGEWSLRWSGTRENCFPEWASSSPI